MYIFKKDSFYSKLLIIVIIVVASFFINTVVYITGGPNRPFIILNIIPIIIAAYFFKEIGSFITAIILGLTNSPIIPFYRVQAVSGNSEDWIYRLLIFMLMALFIGHVSRQNSIYKNKIKESYYKSHVNNLYNTNKLILDLDDFIATRKELCLIYIKILNHDEISKYVNYQVVKTLTNLFIETLNEIFESNLVYTLNSDEFILIFRKDIQNNLEKVQTLVQKFNDPVLIDDFIFSLFLKIGVVKHNGEKINSAELYNKARITADQGDNKLSGVYYYDKEFEQQRILYNEISSSLPKAIEKNEMFLVYQPIIDITNNCITKAEILCRWNRGNKQSVGPNVFIQIAEETGYIVTLSKWIATTALNNYKELRKRGLNVKPSINLTQTEITNDSFKDWGKHFIKNNNISFNDFGIEITERVLSSNIEELNNTLLDLKKYGFIMEIDDFGTGFNSLMTICKIPYDIIKIDRFFIENITNTETFKIIQHTIFVVHEMGGQVIAEGVETKEQFLILKSLNCDYIQGFYFSKPLVLDDFYDYCKSFNIRDYK